MRYYVSLNCGLITFEQYLIGVVSGLRRFAPQPVLVLENFNSKSVAWGSPWTNQRGGVLSDWPADFDLHLINQGSEITCMRRGEGFIEDIRFGSPGVAHKVSGCEMVVGSETLSDHRYMRMQTQCDITAHVRMAPKRDKDVLMAAAPAVTWPHQEDRLLDLEEVAQLDRTVASICNAAMPRIDPGAPRRVVYW